MLENILDTFKVFLVINLIAFSYIGYGLLLLKIFNYKSSKLNIGYIGIAGCFLLILLSYLTIFVSPHNSLHNIIVIIFGLLILMMNYRIIGIDKFRQITILILLTFSFFFNF